MRNVLAETLHRPLSRPRELQRRSSSSGSDGAASEDDSEAVGRPCSRRVGVAAKYFAAFAAAVACGTFLASRSPGLRRVGLATPIANVTTRVLFIGNSLTYFNDLPHQFARIAKFFGQNVEVANSTTVGCTLYALASSARTLALLAEPWDYIVLQENSLVPLFPESREVYMYPGMQAIIDRRGSAKVVAYMTFPYEYGILNPCPVPPPAAELLCWPLGELRQYMKPDCAASDFVNNFSTFSCMGYGYMRAYLSALKRLDIDAVVPAGMSWMLFEGRTRILPACKANIDAQYEEPFNLELSPAIYGGETMPWVALHATVGGRVDVHPTMIGQYLDALTFYRMLLGHSAVGAPQPYCEAQCYLDDWILGPPGPVDPPLPKDELHALQHAADGAVDQCGAACMRHTWMAYVRTRWR